MSDTKKIQRYIELTAIDPNVRKHYGIRMDETRSIFDLINSGKYFEGIWLAYAFGRAKGYRMAKAVAANGEVG